MPVVIAKPDNLDDRNTEFDHEKLKTHVFLNSVPKSGSHLLKNIFRMFISTEQQYGVDFIQYPTLKQHYTAFAPGTPQLSWGHLLFADSSAMALKDLNHVLLIRDPYDWVLARTRFFLSDNFQGNLDYLKHGNTNIDDFMNMMIFGVHNRFPNMNEIFLNNAAAWLGTSAKVVRYEELIKQLGQLDTVEAKTYFTKLLGYSGLALPDDWKLRIKIGSDREQSGTARENLNMQGQEVPKTLPEMQKKLVDYACPGLRDLLGYK